MRFGVTIPNNRGIVDPLDVLAMGPRAPRHGVTTPSGPWETLYTSSGLKVGPRYRGGEGSRQ
jgi:hypothetical protein